MGTEPLLLIHARGDEVVPHSALGGAIRARGRAEAAALLLEGGDHRSDQHDAEIQGETLRWLAR